MDGAFEAFQAFISEGDADTGSGPEKVEVAARTYDNIGLVEPLESELISEAAALRYLGALDEYIQYLLVSGYPEVGNQFIPALQELHNEIQALQASGIPPGEVKETVLGLRDRLVRLELARIQWRESIAV